VKNLILFVLTAIVFLVAAHNTRAQNAPVWIGELIAYRLDTTYVMPNMSSVQQLSLDAAPGWQVFINRSKGGAMISALARVQHQGKWICGIGVPEADRGKPVTRFHVRSCEVFYTYIDVLNTATGASLSTIGPNGKLIEM